MKRWLTRSSCRPSRRATTSRSSTGATSSGTGSRSTSHSRRSTPRSSGSTSDLEVQIPKSIHRLRLAGGGSRFVHGGATLQEIVVPVLAVNKKRKSDTRLVNVEVWPESDKITTGQVVVRLFQSEPVSDKVQPRTVRAGLYAGETLISNQIEMTFDQASSDKRDRYQSARMLLSQDPTTTTTERSSSGSKSASPTPTSGVSTQGDIHAQAFVRLGLRLLRRQR